jgi:hypothetical protein
VPRLLERRQAEGLHIVPVIVWPCPWKRVSWLSSIQSRPKDGRALLAGKKHQIEADLAAIAEEVITLIENSHPVATPGPHAPAPPAMVSLARLPSTNPDLFGREAELARLDAAWDHPQCNMVTLVAWGGVGKTALVNHWLICLAQDNYRGAECVYGYSFYSQGAAEGKQASADLFIATALRDFGDPEPDAGSPWDKGERLARLLQQNSARYSSWMVWNRCNIRLGNRGDGSRILVSMSCCGSWPAIIRGSALCRPGWRWTISRNLRARWLSDWISTISRQ